MKHVYVAMAGHPNMNYDRSTKSVIWDKFPKIYRLFFRYMLEHTATKVHMQLPSQTLNSLKQCGPDVLEMIDELREAGRLRDMGTYYSEPVGMSLDGMSALAAAELGCRISRRECGELEGFFLQEIAYFPQMPYIINRLGLQWVLLHDWADEVFHPYWVEGLDGSRCVGVPCQSGGFLTQLAKTPERVPDNALLLIHSDLEIPVAVKCGEDFRTAMLEHGVHCEWTFVSDYLEKHAPTRTKRPGPCTNKKEGPEDSPSCSRWLSKPLDIVVHAATLGAMEAYRRASLLAMTEGEPDVAYPEGYTERSYTTWDCDQPADYPWVEGEYFAVDGRVSPLSRASHLISWGTNSDARGWYPWLERRHERMESFSEATKLADMVTRAAVGSAGGAGFLAVNPYPGQSTVQTLVLPEPVDLLTPEGANVVEQIRRTPGGWEHVCTLDAPGYTYTPLAQRPAAAPAYRAKQPGARIEADGLAVEAADGRMTIAAGTREMTLDLEPFRIAVKQLDDGLRELRPEGPWRTSVVEGECPKLTVERQIDYHVHFKSECMLRAGTVFATWSFYFTAETMVESIDEPDTRKTDFTPGGILARLRTGSPADVRYDIPLGTVQHRNANESFVPALAHAFLADAQRGVLLASQSGAQSMRVNGSAGEIALCLGRSNTSGGRRKLSFHVGDAVTDVKAEIDWYREPFSGEYVHRFAIRPFEGDWQELAIPTVGRALSSGVQLVASAALPDQAGRMLSVEPANVLAIGARPAERRVVLNEVCGKPTTYRLAAGEAVHEGEIGPFGIAEIELNQ